MEFNINGQNFISDWSDAAAFKGSKADGAENLVKELTDDRFSPIINENGDIFVILIGGSDADKVLEYVSKYPLLKAAAFLDEFDFGNARKTYVCYSPAGCDTFTKARYVGWCDSQADDSFSTMANILQETPKIYSGIHSMTGNKWKIKYSFPFLKEWNNASEAENQQKYLNYKEQMQRLKKALSNNFYLEAIFIEYAIIEDRTASILRYNGSLPKPRNKDGYISIDAKINKIIKISENKKSTAHKYFDEAFMMSLLDWKNRRNALVHVLMKKNLTTEGLLDFAHEGNELVKELSRLSKNYKRALERNGLLSD